MCSVPKARARFEECISSQQEWKQIHHLCYWELMWTHSFQQEWQQAYRYADLLCKESRWSKEMMYVWNGFTIVGKRADYTESLLVTIEKAELQLRNDPNPSEFHPDDSSLVQMLKGLCLKNLGRTNYKDYSMESRLHFRIHAALSSLKGSPVGTP
ncbi:hypothetical protein XENOCAPTIV_025177 [Xenoophorus captivus]|uniref:Uncharacterized protein n=1 Tax=Xenoophorus captivus TaxID=1517983 RepID=A0ABV0QWK4_9TELE